MKMKQAEPTVEGEAMDKDELKEFKIENLERYYRCEMKSKHS
jgi:hypothetical protein